MMKAPDAEVFILKVRNYSNLYLDNYSAKAVAKLLYSDCKIALERQHIQAEKMFQDEQRRYL
jgi:hypothetical protein